MHISEETCKELKGRYNVESGPLVDGMKTYFIVDQAQDKVRTDNYIHLFMCISSCLLLCKQPALTQIPVLMVMLIATH